MPFFEPNTGQYHTMERFMRYSDQKIGLLFFVTSLTIKLPYLGTFLTIDERRWINGAGQFFLALRSGNLGQTYWHFHPGITITWGEVLILWLQSFRATQNTLDDFIAFQMDSLQLSVGAMRLSGVILTSLALPFVYAFARRLVGKWPAILGTGLLAVNPFWVAHSRIVNGDALAGVLMLASFLSFALLLKNPSQKLALISGIFTGLSFLTKLPSQLLIVCIVALAVVGYFKNRQGWFWLKALLLCGLTSGIVFIALWPAMWVAPITTLMMMFADTFEVGDIGGKDQVDFFWGQIVENQSQFFYPLAVLFRLTPISLTGVALALILTVRRHQPSSVAASPLGSNPGGQLQSQPSPKRNTFKSLTLKQASALLLLFVLIIIILANVSPKKADRYVMSVVLAFDLLAGIGWIWLIQQLAAHRQWWLGISHRLGAERLWSSIERLWPFKRLPTNVLLVTAVLIVGQLSFVLSNYPYVLTYYNPLLGGYAKAAALIPVGRGEGLEKAAAWINSQPDGQSATISPYYRNVSNYYLDGRSLDFSDSGESQLLADYVVFYITQTQRKLPFPGVSDYLQNKAPVYTVSHGETPFVWVYKRETPVKKLAGKAEIVGRASLVGYSMPAGRLTPGSSIDIILYMLSKDQDLPQNEDFRVAVLDKQGNTQGQWQSAATNRWLTNGVVEWHGQLSLPTTLAPDDYDLKVSLIDTNIDAEVTHFPFDKEIITIKP